MSFNTYGQNSKTFGARYQVWSEVKGVKHGGGVVDATAFANYPVGSVIPAGTPVYLDKSGGTLKPIYFYELAETLEATDTEAVLYGNYPLTAAGGNIIAVPTAIGGTGAGVAYSAAVDNGDGTHTITIVANSLGTAAAGTVYAEADDAGATGKVVKETAVPNGLLLHDIVKEDGDTWATGAVVDDGRIFEDRIVAVPAAYKAAMPGIKFEKGV
ncbi:hypothetical protein [Proteiniphilum sp. UBA5463]|jgi:hypothetical protein|uniref:hypothetical protein n=1 Tax=Proteiniphilum sp. UBA5463 TaxID=1947281 RepID=UPI00257FD493|nr:hypothetical protein [Proteiniphilum sp. UBA5463]